ncbi:hypothetical protein AOG23_02725 [Rhizobium acidisoli]|nr:hypothetical protein AOG23_02725 [Rhizobium acidisoli]
MHFRVAGCRHDAARQAAVRFEERHPTLPNLHKILGMLPLLVSADPHDITGRCNADTAGSR